MKTLAEIARRLKIPPTTLREYRARFRIFFISKETAGRRFPLYIDETENVARTIVSGYESGLSTDEIEKELLRLQFPIDGTIDDDHKEVSGMDTGRDTGRVIERTVVVASFSLKVNSLPAVNRSSAR